MAARAGRRSEVKRATALTMALRRFVIRHEIFVEAREFDDGRFFIRRWKPGSAADQDEDVAGVDGLTRLDTDLGDGA